MSGYAVRFASGVTDNQLVSDYLSVYTTYIYIQGLGVINNYVVGSGTYSYIDLIVAGDLGSHAITGGDYIMERTTSLSYPYDASRYIDLQVGWLEYMEDEAMYSCTIFATTTSSPYGARAYSMETDGFFLAYGEGYNLCYNQELFSSSSHINTLQHFITEQNIPNPEDYFYWFEIGQPL